MYDKGILVVERQAYNEALKSPGVLSGRPGRCCKIRAQVRISGKTDCPVTNRRGFLSTSEPSSAIG
jgi:hypothetical protein